MRSLAAAAHMHCTLAAGVPHSVPLAAVHAAAAAALSVPAAAASVDHAAAAADAAVPVQAALANGDHAARAQAANSARHQMVIEVASPAVADDAAQYTGAHAAADYAAGLVSNDAWMQDAAWGAWRGR